jgi:hypothetical protein
MYLAEKLNENIYYYKDVLEDPKKFVEILKEQDLNEEIYPVIPKWSRWLSNSNDGVAFGGKKDFVPNKIDELSGDTKEKAKYLIEQVQKSIKKIAENFVKDRGLDVVPNISPFAGVMKYIPGLEMGAHFDAQAGDESLWWSIIVYVNDDYEGGELSWILHDKDLRDPQYSHLKPVSDLHDPLNKDLIDFWIKPEAGSALIFPSTFPYRHQVHIMKSGDKYMFPGFIFKDGYDPFDEESVNKFNGGSKVVKNSPYEKDNNEAN